MKMDENKLTVSMPFRTYTMLMEIHEMLMKYDCSMLGEVLYITTEYVSSASRVSNSTNAEMCLQNPVMSKLIIGKGGHVRGMECALEAMSVEFDKRYAEISEKMNADTSDMEIISHETVSMPMNEYRELTGYKEAYAASRKKMDWCLERMKEIMKEMTEVDTGRFRLGIDGGKFSDFCQYVSTYARDKEKNRKYKTGLHGMVMKENMSSSYHEIFREPIKMHVERETVWDPYRL